MDVAPTHRSTTRPRWRPRASLSHADPQARNGSTALTTRRRADDRDTVLLSTAPGTATTALAQAR
jgi:hypothetical protein